MESIYLIDNFVTLKVGEPIRLLPFGDLIKAGVKRTITQALAGKFKLPHFKPPIKLGSHEDETRAGGFIVDLEVRSDGLYGIPEYTEEGEAALERGDFRYYSPEIIWDKGGYENPETGEFVKGPLLVGLALLHTPHLGEAAALYNFVPQEKETDDLEVSTMTETVQVDKSLWETVLAAFKPQQEPPKKEEPKEPEIKAEEFEAIKQERDDLEAKIEAFEAEKKAEALKGDLRAQLQNKEKFGTLYIELDDAQEAVDILAGMSEEQRNWVMTNFSALIAQTNEAALLAEFGKNGEGDLADDPLWKLNAEIERVQEEKQISFEAAQAHVERTNPALVKSAYSD